MEEGTKLINNRNSARKCRAKRKEHMHYLRKSALSSRVLAGRVRDIILSNIPWSNDTRVELMTLVTTTIQALDQADMTKARPKKVFAAKPNSSKQLKEVRQSSPTKVSLERQLSPIESPIALSSDNMFEENDLTPGLRRSPRIHAYAWVGNDNTRMGGVINKEGQKDQEEETTSRQDVEEEDYGIPL